MSVDKFGRMSGNGGNNNTKQYVDDSRFQTLSRDLVRKLNKNGDVMTGNLELEITGGHRDFGVIKDLNPGQSCSLKLGGVDNQFYHNSGYPIKMATSCGFEVTCTSGKSCKFGGSNDAKSKFYQDIIMNNKLISNLHDPRESQDAATKNYVDGRVLLSAVDTMKYVEKSISNTKSNSREALIPIMTSYTTNTNDTTGYLITKSQDVADPNQFAWSSFANLPLGVVSNGWCTNVNFDNSWIACTFPSEVTATQCLVVGRAAATGNNFNSWVIEATNESITSDATAAAATYTLLYTSNNQSLVGASNISYTVNLTNSTAYTTYRFRSTSGLENPGLAIFQLYSSVNASNNRVINVLDPMSSQDAATKNYVDKKVDECLHLSGGRVTGDITLQGQNSRVICPNAPTHPNHLTNRRFVLRQVEELRSFVENNFVRREASTGNQPAS